jgi:hypothetical protein
VKGEDGIVSRKAAMEIGADRREIICRRNVLTPGSIRSCGISRMCFPAVRRLTPVCSGIHWTRKVLGIGILAW